MTDTRPTDDSALFPPVDPLRVGLACSCPRCGQGRLYDGLVGLRPACSNCGLDYAFADAGDGPAVFVILIIGFLLVGLALWVEVNWSPPFWLHFLLWLPLSIGLCLWSLRVMKALLIALQYRNKARPGEIDRG